MATGTLRLIGTTDAHARVPPYDYYRDAPDERIGLAKAATLVAAARAEVETSLYFDNGDLIQGSPLGDWAAEALMRREIAVHPAVAALNAMGCDAATVGNHEFNYGLETLDAALAGAAYPVVCCNILRTDGAPYFRPWTLLRRRLAGRALTVGVVGFVTPQILRWDRSRLAGRVTTLAIVEAARQHVPACRAAGADVVVALCHSGVPRTGAAGAEENAGLALAEAGGIDAIFVGHQHLLLPGPDFAGVAGVSADGRLAGTPTVMAGSFGRHIGVIDLTLAADARWRVVGAQVELRPVAPETPADPATIAAAEPAHWATLAHVRAPVATLDARLTSYFAMLGDDASVRVVHDAQLWYARKALPEGGPPLLSAAAPFRCGGRGGPNNYVDVPAGALALRHVADLYAYPNGLCVVRATGSNLREWLERAASGFARLDPAETAPQPLLSPDFAAYDFDSFAGLAYRLDLTQAARYDDQGRLVDAAARRVRDLTFEGRALDERAEFHVVTNSYRAGGGGHFPGCDGSALVYEAPDTNFDALLQYVRARGRVTVGRGGAWRLAPWPAGVVATLGAPPEALRAERPPGVEVAPLGPGSEGFLRFRVTPTAEGEAS